MDYMVKSNPSDPFWEYVGHYLQQVRYMHAGYQARILREDRPELALDFQMLYYLPSVGELEDLLQFSPRTHSIAKTATPTFVSTGDSCSPRRPLTIVTPDHQVLELPSGESTHAVDVLYFPSGRHGFQR